MLASDLGWAALARIGRACFGWPLARPQAPFYIWAGSRPSKRLEAIPAEQIMNNRTAD